MKATADEKFKQEVATIDQCQSLLLLALYGISHVFQSGFRVLSEPEKNASVHSLLKHCSQDQLRFLQSIITSMIKPEEAKVTPGKSSNLRCRHELAHNVNP